MTRALLVLVMGVVLGLLVHLVTIMAVPRLAEHDGLSRALAYAGEEAVTVLPAARPGNEALPLLDPSIVYGVCRFDLTQGPVFISAAMPPEFWSMALISREHGVFYSVTQDAAPAEIFDIEIRSSDQMRRFRIQETDRDPQTLYLEAPAETGLVLFRALAEGRSGRAGAEARLAETGCGRLPERTQPEQPSPPPLPRPRPEGPSS